MQAVLLSRCIFERVAKFTSSFMDTESLSIRIGIATGDVVAAIVGKRKYTYDCMPSYSFLLILFVDSFSLFILGWSDTVNTASRMESHGIVDQIQVTEGVYLAMKDTFSFQKRGNLLPPLFLYCKFIVYQ